MGLFNFKKTGRRTKSKIKKTRSVKSVIQSLGKGLYWGSSLGLAFYLGSQTPNFVTDQYLARFPSEERKEFEEFTGGTKLFGKTEDVEGQKRGLFFTAEVIYKEQIVRDFELDAVRVYSDDFWKNPILEQLRSIKEIQVGGMAWGDKIGLYGFGKPTIHHEIKHVKTNDITKEDPDFLDKWAALATGEDGNSMYMDKRESKNYFARGERGENIRDNNWPKDKLEENGFISGYARKNVLEDIAETCEQVEIASSLLSSSLWEKRIINPDTKNKRFIAKIELAQEYSLIPKDFTEWVELKNFYDGLWGYNGYYGRNGIREEVIDSFIIKAEEFLEKNPDSYYEGTVLWHIGDTLLEKGWTDENKREAAIAFTRSLSAKNKRDYFYSLTALERIYYRDQKFEKAEIIREAITEYHKREDEGDYSIITNGVNDFLVDNGIELYE
mgnify:CR=1 FL=1|jgi:hypothetical protein